MTTGLIPAQPTLSMCWFMKCHPCWWRIQTECKLVNRYCVTKAKKKSPNKIQSLARLVTHLWPWLLNPTGLNHTLCKSNRLRTLMTSMGLLTWIFFPFIERRGSKFWLNPTFHSTEVTVYKWESLCMMPAGKNLMNQSDVKIEVQFNPVAFRCLKCILRAHWDRIYYFCLYKQSHLKVKAGLI